MPSLVLRIAGYFNKEVSSIVPHLGRRADATNEKARRVLGWNPRSKEDPLVVSTESLARFGLIKS